MPAKLFARGVDADRFHSASSVASYVTSLSPLCDRSGIALVHNGEVAHAGNAIMRGSRCAPRSLVVPAALATPAPDLPLTLDSFSRHPPAHRPTDQLTYYSLTCLPPS